MRGHEEPPTPPRLHRWSRIELHPLHVQRDDGGEPLLGCAKAASWLVVDEDALRVVEALRRRGSIERAEEWLADATGEEWNVDGLARLLHARGFVRAIDGVPLDPQDKPGRQHRIVFRAPPEWARRLHHPAALGALAALALSWFALVALRPELLPHPSHLMATPRPGLNLVIAFLAALAVLGLHEAAHWLMARSYGIDARIRLSHRLFFPVLETDCTNAWLLRPRQRVRVFGAGIASGLALGAIFAAGALLAQDGRWVDARLAPAFLLLQFVAIVPLAFQLVLFARTDLYYVLLALTGERRLVDDARSWARLQAHRLFARARVPCGSCGRGVAPDEPYCGRCLARRDAADPARFPIRPEQHRRLAWFSALLFPTTLVVVPYTLGTAAAAIHQQASLARALLAEGLAHSRWLLVGEAAAVIAATLASAGLALFFAGRSLARTVLRAWRARGQTGRPSG